MAINSETLCNSCRMNSYIKNGWGSNRINPDKTMHSASAPSLSDVASTCISSNKAAETIVPEWKNIENTLNRYTSSSYGQKVTYFVSRMVNDRLPAVDFI